MSVALAVKKWTLAELHRLPDDGNKYELVRGELFVTPPPSESHETVATLLQRILDPYVARHGLGYVWRARSVMRFKGSEVEPDLMVRARKHKGARDWDDAPTPILVIEILSGSTRRRDFNQKRKLYFDAGVDEYWIVSAEDGTILSIREGLADVVVTGRMTWHPRGVSEPLVFDVSGLFEEAEPV